MHIAGTAGVDFENIFSFSIDYFENPTEHGIDNGRISRLSLRHDGVEVYSY